MSKMLRGVLFSLTWVGMTICQTPNQHLPPELQGDPCSQENSILLPLSSKCLVMVQETMGWTAAQDVCERAGGSLYKMPSARLYSRPQLMDCLSSYDGAGYNDLWINGISLWFSQFLWTNNTVVNKFSYCPSSVPEFKKAPITSDYLSVDYCVSTCHDQGDRFTVIYTTGAARKCNCLNDLDEQYRVPCKSDWYGSSGPDIYYIVHSKENSLLKVGSADTFSSTEIMCATVDTLTVKDREMKSDTCFTKRPFLCELGTASECEEAKVKLKCVGKECLFTCGNKCLKRVSTPNHWYAASSYCSSLGGSLWNMQDLDDMNQVTQFLDVDSRYWIGATNYAWNFDASSTIGHAINQSSNVHRCAHMFREKSTGSVSRSWTWSDADCDMEKSFLCKFVDGSQPVIPHRVVSAHNESDGDIYDQNVTCPWNITYFDAGVTGGPVTQLVVAGDESSFPVAALIAGIIAGLILLTCLGLAFAFCGRRHWTKVKEHLAFIPYFSDNSRVVLGGNSHDFESMSQVGHSRSHMSSVSEHGSQIGLVKGGFSSYAMTSSGFAESNGMFSSKSLDRRHMDSMGQRMADSQHYLASANNSMDERGFAASYSTMPSKQKEYMTLQAHMNIQDEAQLAAMRGSLRHKPEMTLVTDNVDMNLTVNHANGSLAAVESASGSATERVMEEVTLPASNGGVILTFPERMQEANRYTASAVEEVILPASESEVILTFPERAQDANRYNATTTEEVILTAASERGRVILTYPEPAQGGHMYTTNAMNTITTLQHI